MWRKVIPPLVKAGHRVICPDLIGFGKSDKPRNQSDHTYARHVAWVSSFVRVLNITAATLVRASV